MGSSRHIFGALHARKSRRRAMSLLQLCWSRTLQKRRTMRPLRQRAYGVVQASDVGWFRSWSEPQIQQAILFWLGSDGVRTKPRGIILRFTVLGVRLQS